MSTVSLDKKEKGQLLRTVKKRLLSRLGPFLLSLRFPLRLPLSIGLEF